MAGRRVEFDPMMIRRLLEEEDIDVKDTESDTGSNFNQKEKKCTAIVYMMPKEYDY